VKRLLPWTLLALVTLALAVAAAGCGGGDEEEAAPAEAPPAEPAEPPAEPPAETGAADTGATDTGAAPSAGAGEGIKVGLVTDTGGVNDRGFNEFSINGLERAAAELGVETQIYVSNASEDYLPNLSAAAEDGANLVISVGFLIGADTVTAAQEYTDVMFAGVDQFYGEPPDCEESGTCVQPNTLGLIYPSEEAGYLAGIVAAMMTESGTISTVGGIPLPSVDNWIAGFQQGAIDTKPDVTLLNDYSNDFVDQALCKEIALDHIAQGADIVFQVAGLCGLGALDAAKQEGVYAIGVDADQSFAGDHILTSALKPLETSVFGVIESFVNGTFEPGQNFGFSIVDFPDSQLLAPFSPDVPQEVQDAAAEANEKLKTGEIDPPATLDAVVK
jgi:basic membrane protein A and related proteins